MVTETPSGYNNSQIFWQKTVVNDMVVSQIYEVMIPFTQSIYIIAFSPNCKLIELKRNIGISCIGNHLYDLLPMVPVQSLSSNVLQIQFTLH